MLFPLKVHHLATVNLKGLITILALVNEGQSEALIGRLFGRIKEGLERGADLDFLKVLEA